MSDSEIAKQEDDGGFSMSKVMTATEVREREKAFYQSEIVKDLIKRIRERDEEIMNNIIKHIKKIINENEKGE